MLSIFVLFFPPYFPCFLLPFLPFSFSCFPTLFSHPFSLYWDPLLPLFIFSIQFALFCYPKFFSPFTLLIILTYLFAYSSSSIPTFSFHIIALYTIFFSLPCLCFLYIPLSRLLPFSSPLHLPRFFLTLNVKTLSYSLFDIVTLNVQACDGARQKGENLHSL